MLPLKQRVVPSIQDELEEVVDYARKYLPLGTLSYKKVWFKLHTCPDSVKWSNVLLLCDLLFSLPFTTSRVEQTFSRLKNVKTKLRSSLDVTTLHDLLEICVEGPSLEAFDVNAAINLWWQDSCTSHRPNQQPRKDYRPRQTSSSESQSTCSSTSADNETETASTLILDDWDEFFQ